MVSLKVLGSGFAAGIAAVILFAFPAAAEAAQSLPQIICGPGAETLQSQWAPSFNLAQESITRIDRQSAESEAEAEEKRQKADKKNILGAGGADDVKVDMTGDSAEVVLQSRNGVSPFLDAGMGSTEATVGDEEYGTALLKNKGPSVYRLGAGIGCVLEPGAQLKVGYHFATPEETTPLERLTGNAASSGNEEEHKISVDLKFAF